MGGFRHPKTQRERKANIDGAGRPKRTGKFALPTERDDIIPGSRSDRNWKKFRKTKWKEGK